MIQRLRRALTGIFFSLPFVQSVGCAPGETAVEPSNIKSDEDVVFYPTYGQWNLADRTWSISVHGKVFEPEEDSKKRSIFMGALKATSDILSEVDESELREDRVRPFLVDNERSKRLSVEVEGKPHFVGRSGPNGHFEGDVILRDVDGGVQTGRDQSDGERQIEVVAILRDRDRRRFAGRVHLIPPEGVSVISDIDDTIKRSQVTDKAELMRNTFVREFQSVEGMPELYADLAQQSAATFHYVSGSPWQLFSPIDEWMRTAGFPSGSMHMKHFRLKDKSVLQLLGSQQKTKFDAIHPILASFPNRRFILFGDSGEQDPEIYGNLAREHPDQIVGIFIRNVTNEKATAPRFQDAFKDVPRDRWFLFEDVARIHDDAVACAQSQAQSQAESNEVSTEH